jgi:hypothetical protein
MKRNVGILGLMVVVLMAVALAAAPVAAAQPAAIVTGSGTALLSYTSTDLPPGPHPATFRIVGIVRDDGSAKGQLNVVFTGTGAAEWGAVPGVERIHLSGTVMHGTVTPDGTVELSGTLTETDYVADGGIGFQQEYPFMIRAGGEIGTDAFVLQWCALQPFAAEVTEGNLRVHIIGASADTAALVGLRSSRSCSR